MRQGETGVRVASPIQVGVQARRNSHFCHGQLASRECIALRIAERRLETDIDDTMLQH